jgi:hypothetical protein
MPDITVENHGTIILVRPHTSDARNWLCTHCEHAMWYGRAVACEPRYVAPIVEGLIADGFTVE